MKNILKASIVAAAIFSFGKIQAQPEHKDPSVGHQIDATAKKVGHKTSEVAVKGESAVVDKKYKGKCGPAGQTVYINKYDHYYYVSKKGHKIYLKKSQMMDKPSA
jgi:hypothetical protein